MSNITADRIRATQPFLVPSIAGRPQAVRPWLAGAMGIVLVAGACDSTAKFSIPDRKFSDLQVVTAFPAFVDDSGGITRVCGPALDNEIALEPNAVEFTMNFVSTSLKNPACTGDADLSIKEGELIELSPLRTSGANATVAPGNFKVQLQCVEPRGTTVSGTCPTGIEGDGLSPSAVKYQANAGRCNPGKAETWVNVALLLDNSGSTSGLVDPKTNREDSKLVDTPVKLQPSDPSDARISAARLFVQSLNEKDRAIAYHFGEKLTDGVEVAASNNLGCIGGSKDLKPCLEDSDCPGGACIPGGNPNGNELELLARVDAEKKAFGNKPEHRKYLYAALDDPKVKDGGEGRAPLWKALSVAFDFLKNQTALQNRHIIVLTDGPDTCTHSEDLTYVSSDNNCRTPCQTADVDFKALREKMSASQYPVTVHFIQWQSAGYKQPDAGMMEIACRTGGTYQFLNFQEMNQANLDDLNKAMQRAIFRVRYAMSGNWRVGLKLEAIKAPPIGQIATGELYAASGYLQFQNQLFPSLKTPYEYSTNWRFNFDTGNEDRRVIFRRACSGSADCNGSDSCGANHCDIGGICRKNNAPDKLPCSGGVCCSGTCSADCAAACK